MKPADRRFVEYWKDQSSGSRSGYYITYILGWGVVIFFIFFFLSRLFTNLWETGGPYLAFIFIALSLILSFLITHFTYTKNEKRMNKLMLEKEENLN